MSIFSDTSALVLDFFPSAFDMDKLNYFNATYLRALPPEEFAREAETWIRRAVKNPARRGRRSAWTFCAPRRWQGR